eukprot:gb/GFBE01050626.1/.p1 GENE.gb/GFBE01050626.1/~~gb/GFBE01050626.1/.p1  ORF type:complete len:381 (+),score=58.55 gb/GFBE01050626.1/:1-1143(+)
MTVALGVPPIAVQWTTPPEPFLEPVDLALKAAVAAIEEQRVQPTETATKGQRTLVLRISTEYRYEQDKGNQKLLGGVHGSTSSCDSIAVPEGAYSGTVNIVADEMFMSIPARPVLNTALGQWLRERSMMRWVLSASIFLGILMESLPVFYKTTMIGDKTVSTLIPEFFPLLVFNIGLFYFLMLHLSCKKLLVMSATSFDTLVIVIANLTAQVVRIVDLYLLLDSAGVAKIELVTMHIARGAAVFGSICLLVHMDAIRISRFVKQLVLLIITLAHLRVYLQVRLGNIFTDDTTCVWISCTQYKKVFLTALGQCIVFLAKLTYSYAKGLDLAVVKPVYNIFPRESAGYPECWRWLWKRKPTAGQRFAFTNANVMGRETRDME